MSSTGGTLQAHRYARVRLWQVLVVAVVLVAGFSMGIFAGRGTATKSEPVTKPAAATVIPSEVPVCEPCVARYESAHAPWIDRG